MWTIFKPGDIVVAKKRFDNFNNYNIYTPPSYVSNVPEIDVIGRVLEYNPDTCKITLDLSIVNGKFKTGKYSFPEFGFEKADENLTLEFNTFIRQQSEKQDRIYIDFVNSFKEADLETKYKIMDYILTVKLEEQ